MLEPHKDGEGLMLADDTFQTLTDTAETVLKRRYYLKDQDGNPVENWEKLSRRVADAVARGKEEPADYDELRERFYEMIYRMDFLPNSPCLMNAGTDLGQLSAEQLSRGPCILEGRAAVSPFQLELGELARDLEGDLDRCRQLRIEHLESADAGLVTVIDRLVGGDVDEVEDDRRAAVEAASRPARRPRDRRVGTRARARRASVSLHQ